ncbi:reverse transcriptase domain-containing protein [Tanacetum coccineum]|uniref:Reverse transcriptase domain-containing protein n=1 Tax=Tanacetum coccineum TaxID=301880 RepID=A0ABQ5JBP4_9ASTR
MREQVKLNPTPPTSAVRNTMGKVKEPTSKNSRRPAFDAALREYCDKYYHQLMFLKKLKGPRSITTLRVQDSRCKRSQEEAKAFNRIGGKRKSVSAHSESRYHSHHSRKIDPAPKRRYHEGTSSRYTEAFSESEDSRCGHWKSRSKKAKSSIEEDELSQPLVCEETDPFTPRIRYFELPKKSRMPNNIKTYDGSDDPEDHLKKFQAAAEMERWAMPTWYHMFNSTLTGSTRVWFDDLPPESIDSYDDLKKAFLANYLQQKKCIKDPVEIHHIKQREGESMEDFM